MGAVVGGGQISEEDEADSHSVSPHRRVHGRRQRVLELQPVRLDRYAEASKRLLIRPSGSAVSYLALSRGRNIFTAAAVSPPAAPSHLVRLVVDERVVAARQRALQGVVEVRVADARTVEARKEIGDESEEEREVREDEFGQVHVTEGSVGGGVGRKWVKGAFLCERSTTFN